MECKNCRKHIDENDIFCRYCGSKVLKNIIVNNINEQPSINFNQQTVLENKNEFNNIIEKQKNNKKNPIGLMLIILLFIIGYGVNYFVNSNDNKENLEVINVNKKIGNLKYVVFSDFEANTENSNSMHKYIYSETDGACQLKIATATASYYESSESYLYEHIKNKKYTNISEYNEKNINGTSWKTVSIETDDNKVYYYVSSDEDNIYRVELTVTKNEVEYCRNVHNSLLSNLKVK